MKKHGIWTMVALVGAVVALIGLVMCVVTGHQMVKERKRDA